MHVRGGERGLRPGRLKMLLLAGAALCFCAIVSSLLHPQAASAQASNVNLREGTIDGPTDQDWFPLFAVIGESFVLSLERGTLVAGLLEVWKPAAGDAPAERAARSVENDSPLIWSAPESGAWRVRVSGLNGATGSYRLSIRSDSDDVGASLSTARAARFDERGILIERSSIDHANDVDWFAFPVARGNRYRLWSVRGSIGGLSGSLRAPSAESFQALDRVGNLVAGVFEPIADGIAVFALGGLPGYRTGSYAIGVTREGGYAEPTISLPLPPTSELRIRSIEVSAADRDGGSHAEFAFQGAWGPIQQSSGLRVWIDTDPGADDEDEWEYLLRSNDGRVARWWSFEHEAWVDASQVGARGFDTLVMRWSGRTSDEQIRWQASVKNSDGSWTVSRPRFLELPHPRPALPPLWPARTRTGSEDPRWHEELAAAGAAPDLDDDAGHDAGDDAMVVVLDPGHGVDTGAWDNGVLEAESNLAFALRIEELLEERGITVALTRRAAGRPYLNLDEALWRPDFQVRAELAHLAMADVFVSIHSNANYEVALRGLEAWYLPRSNGDGANLRLSETLMASVQDALDGYGYPTSTLTYDASCWEIINDVCDPIYVLAPFLLIDADAARRYGLEPSELGLSEDPWGAASNPWRWRNDITVSEPPIDLIDPQTQSGPGRIVRGNLMPTTLLELLYVTEAGDARILRDPRARELIARAIADGILDFLGVR